MAGFLPTVYGGHTVLAPYQRSINAAVTILKFEGGQEQRYVDAAMLDSFQLTYTAIPKADRDQIEAFFANQKGSYDKVWYFWSRPGTPLLPNGSFAQGFQGWTVVQDNTNSFVPLISTFFSRTGEASAIMINQAITIPANTAVTANYTSTSTFPLAPGEQIRLNLWGLLGFNSNLPSGVTMTLRPALTGFNSSASRLGDWYLPTQLVYPSQGGWGMLADTFAACPYPNVASAQPFVLFTLTNTTSSGVSIPYNSAVFGITAVDVFRYTAEGLYPGCTFEDDNLTWTVNAQYPKAYDTTLRFRQTLAGGQGVSGSAGAAFPKFGPNSSFASGYPFRVTSQNMVARNDVSTGNRVSYAFTGSPNFPSRALKQWQVELPTLTDTDAAALEQHFLAQNGPYRTFSFFDPTTSQTSSKVRYASDSLTLVHLQKNLHRATVALQELPGSVLS